MKVLRILIMVAASLIPNACHHGMTAEKFPPARTANGVMGTVRTDQTEFGGELIEVRDAGIVILAAQTFRLLPYTSIVSSHFEGVPHKISGRHAPAVNDREHLRLVSRFPHGISPELLQTLLATPRQTALAGEKP